MKAPTDKRNDTIQIIVTRACSLFTCSNCTQLLPFRKDALHMGVDVFRAAVRSVKDWPGVVAMFGGNPCNHPKFPELCAILEEEIPQQKRRGLWSNDLRGHGETVRRVFYPSGRFNLNAHAEAGAADEIERHLPGKLLRESRSKLSQHSPILVHWKDLGMTEEDWIAVREDCDINKNWSAAIVERDGEPFAYFCEVGAAIDGIRGENNGIPAVPGWWRLKMSSFEHQVRNCCDAGCGVPLRLRGHLDREDTYDVSESWGAVAVPKSEKSVKVVLPVEGKAAEATDYLRRRTKD